MESFVQLRAWRWKRGMALVEEVECRASEMLKGLEHPSAEEKLSELGGVLARRQSC